MAGLDTRGAFDGFVQGFGLVNNYLNQQKQNERADQQMGLQMRAAERADQQFAAQMDDREKQHLALMTDDYYKRSAAHGNWLEPSEELLQGWGKHRYLAPSFYQDERTTAALNYADKLAAGEGSLWGRETVGHMDHLFSPWVNRGDGGEKHLSGIYPGQQEGTFVFELEVTPEMGLKYKAPMTANRGVAGKDDEIMQMPIERVIQQTFAMKPLHQIASQLPPFPYGQPMSDAERKYAQMKGYLPKEQAKLQDVTLPDGTVMQVDPETGAKKVVYQPREGNAGRVDDRARLSLQMFDTQIKEIDSRLKDSMSLEDSDVAALQEQRRALIAQRSALAAEIGLPGFSQGQQQGEPAGPVKVTSKAEFEALPPGTVFISPDGQRRIKPAGGDQPTRSTPAQQPPQEQPQKPAQPADWRGRLEEHFASAQEGSRAQQERYAEARNYRPVTAGPQMPEQPRRPWDNAGLTLPPGFPR